MKDENKAAAVAIGIYLTPVLFIIFNQIPMIPDEWLTYLVSLALLVYGIYLLINKSPRNPNSEAVKKSNESWRRIVPRLVILIISGYVGAIFLVILAELPESSTPTLVNITSEIFGLDAFVNPIGENPSPFILNLVLGLGMGFSMRIGAEIDNRIWTVIDSHF